MFTIFLPKLSPANVFFLPEISIDTDSGKLFYRSSNKARKLIQNNKAAKKCNFDDHVAITKYFSSHFGRCSIGLPEVFGTWLRRGLCPLLKMLLNKARHC
jgi:hypothetical protein